MRRKELHLCLGSAQKGSGRLKVLLVSGSYPPLRCGVGDYAALLAAALSDLPEVCVEVLTSGGSSTAESVNGVRVWRSMEDWRLKRWMTIARMIQNSKPDYVHIQYPTQGYLDGYLPRVIPLLAWVLGAKVVQTWHEGCPIRRPLDVLLKAIVPGELVVVRPNYRKNNLHPLLGWLLQRKNFKFIPNASAVPKAALSHAERSSAREALLQGQQRLIVFFGFVLPSKGAELVFDIADPATDRVILAGEMGDERVSGAIASRTQSAPWKGKAEIVGFLPPEQVAALLSVADAVVLPFRAGGGEWNTSIHAATMQGTFVLTTSSTTNGYSAAENVYFAKVDDVAEMREALRIHAGQRASGGVSVSWKQIAREHLVLYRFLRN